MLHSAEAIDWPLLTASAVLGAPHLKHDGGGTVIWFDGKQDGLLYNVNPLARLRAFTVEILIKPSARGPTEPRFFHVADDQARRCLLELRRVPGGRWALDGYLHDGDHGLTLVDCSQLHAPEQWHWVALSYASGIMTTFVDAVRQLQGEVSFSPMEEGRMSLGVRLNRVHWFHGQIRTVRIHGAGVSSVRLMRPG